MGASGYCAAFRSNAAQLSRPKIRAATCFTAIPTGAIQIADLLIYLLAGGASERKLTGKVATLDSSDLERARLAAAVLVNADADDPATDYCLKRYSTLVDALMVIHWSWIARTADVLQRKRALTRDQIAALG